MSRLSEVRSLQSEREKDAYKNNKEADISERKGNPMKNNIKRIILSLMIALAFMIVFPASVEAKSP